MESYKTDKLIEVLVEKVMTLECINNYLDDEVRRLKAELEEAKKNG